MFHSHMAYVPFVSPMCYAVPSYIHDESEVTSIAKFKVTFEKAK